MAGPTRLCAWVENSTVCHSVCDGLSIHVPIRNIMTLGFFAVFALSSSTDVADDSIMTDVS